MTASAALPSYAELEYSRKFLSGISAAPVTVRQDPRVLRAAFTFITQTTAAAHLQDGFLYSRVDRPVISSVSFHLSAVISSVLPHLLTPSSILVVFSLPPSPFFFFFFPDPSHYYVILRFS